MAGTLAKPGALPRPGPLGRAVRLLVGALCLYLFFVIRIRFTPEAAPDPLKLLLVSLLLLCAAAETVRNFRPDWRLHAGAAMAGLLAVAALADFLRTGSPWGAVLGWVVLVSAKAYLLAIGVSFLLAGVVASPG